MSLVNDSRQAGEPEPFDEWGEGGGARVEEEAQFSLVSGREAHAQGTYVGVVFNRPIDQVLTYRVPASLVHQIGAGQRVNAPLGRGNKAETGHCVWVSTEPPADCEPFRIKEILEVLDPVPLIDDKMLALTRWLAEYYACSWGQALDAAVPAGVKKHAGTRIGTYLVVPEETREGIRAKTIQPKLSPKQAIALEVLARSEEPLTLSDLCRLAKCTPGPIHILRKQGLIHSVKKRLAFGEKGAARLASDSASHPKPEGTPVSYTHLRAHET